MKCDYCNGEFTESGPYSMGDSKVCFHCYEAYVEGIKNREPFE